jgi:hypothetical protein
MPGRTLRREVPRNRLFAGIFCGNRRCTFCLPCRRSRVRIPSAASGKGLQTGVFFRAARLVGASEFPRTGRGPARAAAPPDLKLGGFAGEVCSGRTVVILRAPQKTTGSDRVVASRSRASSRWPSCSRPGRPLAGGMARTNASRPEQACPAPRAMLAWHGKEHVARDIA